MRNCRYTSCGGKFYFISQIDAVVVNFVNSVLGTLFCVRARGAMDNASAYGAEDSRFESWRARYFFRFFIYRPK